MSPAVIRALLDSLADWRAEAANSRRSADPYGQTAAEHRADAERAEQAAAEIETALRETGIDPAPEPVGATSANIAEGLRRIGAVLREQGRIE